MYRIIDSKIWEDSWFFDLSSEQKLLFLYLITSAHTNQLGIFSANIKYVKIETGIENVEDVLRSLYPKVLYFPQLNLILIRNFIKYQNLSGAKFEKYIFQKFLEQSEEVKLILLRESETLKSIIGKFDNQLVDEIINSVSIEDKGLEEGKSISQIPYRYPMDGVSIGYPTEPVPDTETDTESEPDTETQNLNQKKASTTVDEQAQAEEKKQSSPKREKFIKPKKYPEEVINFVKEFKTYREDFLKIPITHKDWHLKSYAIVNKLLKKYSLQELKEALSDLMTPAWEDKAVKIVELWHFEDWLPRWKMWKYPPSSAVGSQKQDKYRRLYYEVFGKYPEQ